MGALSILHPCINVASMDEAVFFFRDLLGLKVIADSHVDPGVLGPLLNLTAPECRSVRVRCPDESEIELLQFDRPRGEPTVHRRFEDAGISVITLVVDDLGEMIERLGRSGYPAQAKIVRFSGDDEDLLAVHVHGPSGIPVTLSEWVPAQSRATWSRPHRQLRRLECYSLCNLN